MNKVYNMIKRKQILFARIITTAITYAKLLIQNVNIGKNVYFMEIQRLMLIMEEAYV